MIAIERKNISCFYSNTNLFLCNFNVHLLLSIHPFSSSRIKRRVIPRPSTEICDVLVNKHKFSHEVVSLASLRLTQVRCPKRVDSVLSFMKENSFTTPQLEKIVLYYPRILGLSMEGLKIRFKVFHDLGLSPEEVAKIMNGNQSIFKSSVANRIVPKLSMLKGLLGSNQEVARVLRNSSWFLTSDLEKTLMPNVEILKSHGTPMERILGFLNINSRFLLIKPVIMRKSVDRAIEYGFSPSSLHFLYAAMVFGYTSEGMWEVKLRTLRDLGFSDDDIFTMFRKQPQSFLTSLKKLKNVIEILLATGKYNISNILTYPSSFGYSIEKRIKPRLQILGVLESRNLIEKWPTLSILCHLKNDDFFDSFIRPYYDEIGEEHITKIYGEGKRR